MWETGSWDRACHKRTCPWPESKPDPSVQGPIFHPRSPTSQDFRGDVMNSAERCLHRQSCHAPGAGVPRPCRGQGNGGPALLGVRTCPPQPARPGHSCQANRFQKWRPEGDHLQPPSSPTRQLPDCSSFAHADPAASNDTAQGKATRPGSATAVQSQKPGKVPGSLESERGPPQ